MTAILKRVTLSRGLLIALVFGACAGLTACNRGLIRVPGASLAFPQTPTGFTAKKQLPDFIEVAAPVDQRPEHYGEAVAGTKWDGCRTDALWRDTASGILRERLTQEIASANLFRHAPTGLPAASGFVLKSEIHAFCSQAVGAFFVRIAGITAIRFTLEKDGKVVWERKVERVVTDADPEYTGGQVGFIEHAMRTAMADSLRMVLGDLLKALDLGLSQAAAVQAS